MSTYRKYSFPNEDAYKALLEEIIVPPIEGIEQQQIGFDAVPITCIKVPAVMKDGKVVTEAVIDTNYNVDILWVGEEPKLFVEYQVWPNGIGQHIVAGWESIYEADRKVALNIVEPKIELK